MPYEKLLATSHKATSKNPQDFRKSALEAGKLYEGFADGTVKDITDEVPFEIPESWEWVRLKNIVNVVSARRVHQSDWKTSGVPFYRAREIGTLSEYDHVNNELFISEELYAEFSKSGVPQKDDLMITAVGTLGKVYIVKETDRFYYKDASVICLENFGKTLPEYLKIVIHSPYLMTLIKKKSAGTTVDTITIVNANEYLIPIPPLNEQARIVSKLRECIPALETYNKKESCLSNMNTAFPEILKKSILQQAVMGKLVPQDSNDEPASVLLERIRMEKAALIKAGKLKKDKHESIIYRRDNSHYEKRDDQEVCIDDEIPFNIPDSWSWMRLSSFGVFSSGKTPSMSDPQNWGGNIPWVSSKDMKRQIIMDSEMHITEYAAMSMQLYPKGTLLLVSRSGILRRLLPLCVLGIESTINQDIKAFSLYDMSLSEWLFYSIKAFEPMILHDLVKSVTTVESLKFDEFADLLIPVPPYQEQLRIIEAIQNFMKLIKPIHYDPLFSL